ncbi:hypothetical protein V5799_031651 [Amblyomma americanum]|uniref:Secreted protein n=1 Tax=Amblyomma americanum TaxID=6943 RepID=A0AAQ4DTE9_AMBAM
MSPNRPFFCLVQVLVLFLTGSPGNFDALAVDACLWHPLPLVTHRYLLTKFTTGAQSSNHHVTSTDPALKDVAQKFLFSGRGASTVGMSPNRPFCLVQVLVLFLTGSPGNFDALAVDACLWNPLPLVTHRYLLTKFTTGAQSSNHHVTSTDPALKDVTQKFLFSGRGASTVGMSPNRPFCLVQVLVLFLTGSPGNFDALAVDACLWHPLPLVTHRYLLTKFTTGAQSSNHHVTSTDPALKDVAQKFLFSGRGASTVGMSPNRPFCLVQVLVLFLTGSPGNFDALAVDACLWHPLPLVTHRYLLTKFTTRAQSSNHHVTSTDPALKDVAQKFLFSGRGASTVGMSPNRPFCLVQVLVLFLTGSPGNFDALAVDACLWHPLPLVTHRYLLTKLTTGAQSSNHHVISTDPALKDVAQKFLFSGRGASTVGMSPNRPFCLVQVLVLFLTGSPGNFDALAVDACLWHPLPLVTHRYLLTKFTTGAQSSNHHVTSTDPALKDIAQKFLFSGRGASTVGMSPNRPFCLVQALVLFLTGSPGNIDALAVDACLWHPLPLVTHRYLLTKFTTGAQSSNHHVTSTDPALNDVAQKFLFSGRGASTVGISPNRPFCLVQVLVLFLTGSPGNFDALAVDACLWHPLPLVTHRYLLTKFTTGAQSSNHHVTLTDPALKDIAQKFLFSGRGASTVGMSPNRPFCLVQALVLFLTGSPGNFDALAVDACLWHPLPLVTHRYLLTKFTTGAQSSNHHVTSTDPALKDVAQKFLFSGRGASTVGMSPNRPFFSLVQVLVLFLTGSSGNFDALAVDACPWHPLPLVTHRHLLTNFTTGALPPNYDVTSTDPALKDVPQEFLQWAGRIVCGHVA